MSSNEIPDIVIGRLPVYLRALSLMVAAGQEITSSHELGEKLGISSAQIRKDLSHFGEFGKQGTGYRITHLIDQLRRILKVDREWPVALIGVGDVGQALIRYGGFRDRGFRIALAFDADPAKVGQPIGDPQSRSRVGFLPEHFRFHDWLNGAEFLELHAQLYGVSEADRRQRIPALLKRVGLEEHATKKLRGYSKGMLQRVGLAQALLNHPAVVFLDEPTSGLDPIGRILVRDIIRELRDEGTTVFLNSHLLSEVEITCDRVVFIKHGTVVKAISLKEIEEGATQVQIRIGAPDAARDRTELEHGLLQFGADVHVDTDHIHLTVANQTALPELARWLIGQGLDLYALAPQHVSLEDMFLQIVGTDGGL